MPTYTLFLIFLYNEWIILTSFNVLTRYDRFRKLTTCSFANFTCPLTICIWHYINAIYYIFRCKKETQKPNERNKKESNKQTLQPTSKNKQTNKQKTSQFPVITRPVRFVQGKQFSLGRFWELWGSKYFSPRKIFCCVTNCSSGILTSE